MQSTSLILKYILMIKRLYLSRILSSGLLLLMGYVYTEVYFKLKYKSELYYHCKLIINHK